MARYLLSGEMITIFDTMKRSLPLVSILLFWGPGSICFGFVCPRHPPSDFRRSHQCRGRGSRLMMAGDETPPPSSAPTAPAEKAAIGKLSKRKRVANAFRRVRSRLASILGIRSSATDDASTPEDDISGNAPSSEYAQEVEVVSKEFEEEVTSNVSLQSEDEPSGEPSSTNTRQAIAADDVDLSGAWKPIVTEQFKQQYDAYLVNCSQPFLFRKLMVNGIQYQTETIRQLNDGVDLEIVAANPAGNWNRTLVASDETEPLNVTVTDPDGDVVQVQAWWEDDGTKHKSILQDKPRVEGGYFKTVRYLESENVLVCDSSFIPPRSSTKFKYGNVVWRFQRAE